MNQEVFYLSTEIPEEVTVCVFVVGMQLSIGQYLQVFVLVIEFLINRTQAIPHEGLTP